MLRTLTLLFCTALFAPAFAAMGGPDSYGYIWKDSNEPGGPVYNWIDITTTGTEILGLGDDNIVGPYTMATDHPFYWYGRKNIWIASNGYIAFNSGNIASPFPTIPMSGGVNDYIAAMASDLNFAGVGNPGRCYWHDTEDRTVVSYVNVPFWTATAPTYTGSNTFQIILDKLDSTITIQYQQQMGITNNNDLLIGIESVAGSIGLQHSMDLYPAVNFAIRFYLPAQTSLEISDASIGWNTMPGNGGQFLSRNGMPLPLVTNVRNTGNTNLSSVGVLGDVRNAANAVQASGSATVNFIIATLDQTVGLSSNFNPTTAGVFKFTSTVSPVPNELVPDNNTKVQELVVVDTMALEHDLKFTGILDDGIGLGWDGGNGGVAMHIVPPYYPAYASATTVRIASNAGLSGFTMKVYADDGPNGTAGTLRDSVDVPAAMAVAGDLVIPLSTPMTITGGGVYVLWYMNGPNVNIAQDIVPPFSLQTYEVLGNTWAEYRDRENTDFHIGLRLVQEPLFDIGCSGFFGVTPGQNIATPITVRAWLTNYGNQPSATFPVSYRFGNGTTVTQSYTGNVIQPGQQVLFSFTQQYAPTGDEIGDLCAWSAWSMDADNSNDTTCVNVNTFTGLNELVSIAARIRPNPTSDQLLVDGLPPGDFLLVVSDAQGRIVQREKRTIAGTLRLDVASLPEGIYHFNAIGGSGSFTTGFVVQH